MRHQAHILFDKISSGRDVVLRDRSVKITVRAHRRPRSAGLGIDRNRMAAHRAEQKLMVGCTAELIQKNSYLWMVFKIHGESPPKKRYSI